MSLRNNYLKIIFNDLLLSLGQMVQTLDYFFSTGSHDLVGQFTIMKKEKLRNRCDLEVLTYVLQLGIVQIYFVKSYGLGLLCQLFKDRSYHSAWSAPLG
jgi:hypothetical protein